MDDLREWCIGAASVEIECELRTLSEAQGTKAAAAAFDVIAPKVREAQANEITALRAEIARLREASAALIADLREAMPHIDNAIHIAAIHHCPYKGKSLQPAMNALAAALGEQP